VCACSYLVQPDDRGDSPLHAAACNGSLPCCRLLLEYGVAPDVLNQGKAYTRARGCWGSTTHAREGWGDPWHEGKGGRCDEASA